MEAFECDFYAPNLDIGSLAPPTSTIAVNIHETPNTGFFLIIVISHRLIKILLHPGNVTSFLSLRSLCVRLTIILPLGYGSTLWPVSAIPSQFGDTFLFLQRSMPRLRHFIHQPRAQVIQTTLLLLVRNYDCLGHTFIPGIFVALPNLLSSPPILPSPSANHPSDCSVCELLH